MGDELFYIIRSGIHWLVKLIWRIVDDSNLPTSRKRFFINLSTQLLNESFKDTNVTEDYECLLVYTHIVVHYAQAECAQSQRCCGCCTGGPNR